MGSPWPAQMWTANAADLPAGVSLTWIPASTVQQDYTVFIQVLDIDDKILAQVDRQPQAGAYPTSTWRNGDVITDTLNWNGDVSAWRRIVLGLYDSNGQRLKVTAPTTSGDAVEILRRDSAQGMSLSRPVMRENAPWIGGHRRHGYFLYTRPIAGRLLIRDTIPCLYDCCHRATAPVLQTPVCLPFGDARHLAACFCFARLPP